MPSFLEKLKKGMGVEEPIEETIEEKPQEKIVRKPRAKRAAVEKPRKLEIKAALIEEEIEPEEEKSEEKKIEIEIEKEDKEDKDKWFEPEGQLAIDVFQTENDLIIQSAIAGVKPDSLDISMEKDIITIKGIREKPFEENGDYFTQECFWGPFSREVILPTEVDPNRSKAEMKEGILTIKIPKILREKKRRIIVTS